MNTSISAKNLDNAQIILFEGKTEKRVQANFYPASPGAFKNLSVWKG